MRDRSDGGENPRQKWERSSDRPEPVGAVQAAYRFANDHGPVALIAVAAIGFMAYLWMTALSGMAVDLREHVRDSGRYQRQTCISLAIMSGTPKEFCDAEQHR